MQNKINTPFANHFDMDKFFEILWRGRKRVGVGVLLFLHHGRSPTPEDFKTFVHIEMLGKWSTNFEIR